MEQVHSNPVFRALIGLIELQDMRISQLERKLSASTNKEPDRNGRVEHKHCSTEPHENAHAGDRCAFAEAY